MSERSCHCAVSHDLASFHSALTIRLVSKFVIVIEDSLKIWPYIMLITVVPTPACEILGMFLTDSARGLLLQQPVLWTCNGFWYYWHRMVAAHYCSNCNVQIWVQYLANIFTFLGHIAVLHTQTRPVVTYRVAWSVDRSLCGLSRSWALKKPLNRSRCRLGCGLGWAQGTIY